MNAKSKSIPLWLRLILIVGLAFAASSCETSGQRKAAIAGGVVGAAAIGAATDSWVGAAIGGAAGAAIGSRVHQNRVYHGRRTLFR